MDLPQPITREELYLAYYVGLRGFALPSEPATRIELYLAKLCGKQSVQLPSRPVTNAEIYLAKLCGEDVQLPAEPILRVDFYLAKLCGEDVQLPPEPYTKTEAYLAFAATSEVSEVVISGEMSTIEDTLEGIGFSEVQLLGKTFQENYSGEQLLTKEGFATPAADTDFWHTFSTSVLSQTPLSDGWAHIETLSAAFGNMQPRWSAIHGMAASTQYTLIVELKNIKATGSSLDLIQPNQSQDPFASFEVVAGATDASGTCRIPFSSSITEQTAVIKVMTKDVEVIRGLRFFTRDAVPVGSSFDIRVTILAGDHSSDWQNYAGDNWQPYVGAVPAPNPDYPQDIEVVTGEQNIRICGKNLLPVIPQNTSGVSVTYDNESGEISVAGTPSNEWIALTPYIPIDIPEGTELVAKRVQEVISGPSPISCAVRLRDDTNAATDDLAASLVNPTAKIMSKNITRTQIWAHLTPGEFCSFKWKIQMEKATATAFVPYQDQTYPVNLVTANNLFDKNNFNELNAYFTGTVTNITLHAQNRLFYLPCEPNTTYALAKVSSAVFDVGYTETTPAAGVAVKGIIHGARATRVILKTGANAQYIVCRYYHTNNDTIPQADVINSIQVGIPLELAKLGDYQDYIWTDGEKWYKHKKLYKYVFDENYDGGIILGSTSTADYNVFVFQNVDVNLPKIDYDGRASSLCNYYTKAVVADLNTGKYYGLGTNRNGACRFFYASARTSRFADVTAFETWLANNNIILYAPLLTPTDEEITDETLIAQLNALASAYGYAGQTNFFITAESPNLPAGLKLKVRRAA